MSIKYDLIILFDWQTGLVPVYKRLEPSLEGIPIVFVAYNTSEQGLFTKYLIPEIGLSWDLFNFRELEFWGQLSFIKGGLVFSDKIVLPNSSGVNVLKEESLGFGLEDLLKTRQEDIKIILPCFRQGTKRFTEEDKKKAKQRILLKSCFSDNSLPLIMLPINKELEMYNVLEWFFKEGMHSLECNWVFFLDIDTSPNGKGAKGEGSILNLAYSNPNKVRVVSEGFSYTDICKASDMMLFLAHIAGTGYDLRDAIRHGTWIIGNHSTGLDCIYTVLGFSPSVKDALHIPYIDYNKLFSSIKKSLKLFEGHERETITKAMLGYKRGRIDIATEFLSLLN